MITDKFNTLVVLAKEKNYTKTAELCNITQPAVTQHIQSLESFYNINIFRRKGKDLLITPEGEILIEEAKKLLAINKGIKKKLSRSLEDYEDLNIGITLTASNHFIPQVVEFLKNKFPQVRYKVHTSNVKQIYDMLRFNELDFAVIDGMPPTKEFKSSLLEKDELIFIASSKHRLANYEGEITLDMLKKEKMILRDKKANTRIVFENYLLNHFSSVENFDIILEIESTSLIKRLVIEGHGISIMSRVICEHLIEQNVLTEIKVKDFRLERGIYLIYPKEIENDKVIKNIINL